MRHLPVVLLLLAGLGACADQPDPSYEYGTDLFGLGQFDPIGPDVGVHPDDSVLIDPDNPFRRGISGEDAARFDALEAGPIYGFYAFATALTAIPFGENQYYSALQLQLIYEQELAAPEDLALVRSLAIRGFQAVLDDFPDTAFTFDPSGRFQFDLLAPSVQRIIELGGTPQNGWTLITGPDGVAVAVQSGE